MIIANGNVVALLCAGAAATVEEPLNCSHDTQTASTSLERQEDEALTAQLREPVATTATGATLNGCISISRPQIQSAVSHSVTLIVDDAALVTSDFVFRVDGTF
ncbi:hypothetical protein IE81DRAFT_242046 [Ceraceosorus guamensis]|uniref:Uncharacterized protein n=1 Tax=Ceraceosorus guamensis TaxID=1522189 RepID=A0A316W6Y5_9BASI|nr:hypothetical protein IE81DRAFT_242046 [Ceraceosorus guamensis]PWN44888.1 hypothetical protein IE81DRAFT_242046 [Ceraceosorus guamensis]